MPVVEDGPPATPGAVHQGYRQTQSGSADSAILITGGEVRFATAAAKGLPTQYHRWAVFRRIIAALAWHAKGAATLDDSRPRYHPIPRRLTYLEDARLKREMSRL